MTQPSLYLNNFTLAESKGISPADNFPHYLYDISSNKLNSQFFSISEETHDSIARQANEGVPVYKDHRTYSEDPAGYTLSAKRSRNKVRSEIYIQPNLSNPDTNDMIARMDAGTMRDGSISFLGGDFISDIDGTKFKYQSDGFFYSFKSESGHYLGQELDNGKIVTATVFGEVILREFSVTGRGADPGSGIVKKLHEEFGNEPIDRGVIHALAEINGFDLDRFCLQLGFDNSTGVKSFSFPTNPQPEGDSTMANDADIQQLQKQIKDLSDERDTLKTENAELEQQLEQASNSDDEVRLLREQVTELEQTIETKDQEVARVQTLAQQGEKALRLAKDTAKRSLFTKLGLNPADDHSSNYLYVRECNNIEEMTDINAINSIADSNFGGQTGRKSSINGYTPTGEGKAKKPRMSGANHI